MQHTVSTDPQKSVKLAVAVSGIAMSEPEAQKLASSIQSSLAAVLGVDAKQLEVEVTIDGAAPEEEVEEAVEEDAEEMSPEDITALSPEEFKAQKAKIKAGMGAK